METRAGALVVEDNALERAAITQLLRRHGMNVLETASADQARRLLRTNEVSIAVVDWDLGGDGRRTQNSQRLLSDLAKQEHRTTLTLVYTMGYGNLAVDGAVLAANPYALMQNKRDGPDAFQRRLQHLLTRHVGDLRTDDLTAAAVVHIPSGDSYGHRIAHRLLIGHPTPVFIDRAAADYWGMWRFRKWLAARDSSVTVTSRGRDHFYRLIVADQ